MKEYGRPYDLLQNTNSLFYKMVQQLGEAEAAALTERAEQVSLLQGVVVEVCLQGSLLTISTRGLITRTLCPFNQKPPETKAS